MATPPYSARARPFAMPGRLDVLAGPKAIGVVELPTHVEWGHRRTYDLSERADLCRMYEQVLREGTLADLADFVDADVLIDVWDELFLPDDIRLAWASLIEAERGIQLSC